MIETLWCAMCEKVHIVYQGGIFGQKFMSCDSIPPGTLMERTEPTLLWCKNFDVGTFSTTESGWAALQQCIVTDCYREFKRFDRTRKLFNRMLSDSLWITDFR